MTKPETSHDVWMPLFIGDMLKETNGFSDAAFVAYIKTLMKYWTKGGPLTDEEMGKICGRNVHRVCEAFIRSDGQWRSPKLDYEIERAKDNIKRMKDLSQRGVLKRRQLGQLPPGNNGETQTVSN